MGMAGRRRRGVSFLVFALLLLAPPPPRAAGLLWFGALGRWGTLLSLSQSLMERVGTARAEKGDLPGAARARAIAHKLELLGARGTGGGILSMCWDYLRNYAWGEGGALGGPGSASEIHRAAAELVAALEELGRAGSDAERARWAGRNYSKLVSAANAALHHLSQAFSRSGALRETVLMLQRELAEGELLRDCLQVGARDLEGLLRVARDLVFSYSAASSMSRDSEHEL